MPTFTVHVPPGIGDTAARADRTVFVREGFGWAAFLFGPFYLLYRRLWLPTVAWVAAAAGLMALARAFDLPVVSWVSLYLVLALLTGLEAGEARRRALGRRGYLGSALLCGVTRETAERLFFGREAASGIPDAWAASFPGRRMAPSDIRRGSSDSGRLLRGVGQPAVIGLFPSPGDGAPGRRS